MKLNNKQRMAAIHTLIQDEGFINATQACRILNGRGLNEFSHCYFSFREKPKGTRALRCRNRILKHCCYAHGTIYYSCMRLTEQTDLIPPVNTLKVRFWDGGGIGTDLFRFFYCDQDLFKRAVLDNLPGNDEE